MISAGAGVLALGAALFDYWRVPVRLWKRWRAGTPPEPAVHQVWTEGRLSKKDVKWRVTRIKDGWIYIEQIDLPEGDEVKLVIDHSTWEHHVKSNKMFCSDRNDSLHDSYWGKVK